MATTDAGAGIRRVARRQRALRLLIPAGDVIIAPVRRTGSCLSHLPRTAMAKVIRCRDVGFDCDGVVRAASEDEALRQVADHARTAHGVEEITPDILARVRSVMRDEPARA